ncbi:hypothetical protein JW859_07745 [bacterium]|nr:hypothetical protein [bacterium]
MFTYHELDGFTRRYMRLEFMLDKEQGVLYQSRLLTEEGLAAFPDLLLEALNTGTIESLADRLTNSSYWGPRARENSHLALAEEQYNQYYMRAILRKLIEEGEEEAEVYRASDEVMAGRRGAQPGDRVKCTEALEDLRDACRQQWRGATGLVRGAKAGISLKRIGSVRTSG